MAAGRLDLDLARRRVIRADGREERLTALEAALVAYLRTHADRVVGRDELLNAVWGYGPGTVSRAVDHAVGRVRAKLEDDPSDPEHLLTTHGGGYRWVEGDPAPNPSPAPAPAVSGRRYTFGDRVLDLDRARVEGVDGGQGLTAAEIGLLEHLLRAEGRSIDRDHLQRSVWGGAHGRAIENAVYRLRRKLEGDPAAPAYLLTTSDGYRLERGPAVHPRRPRVAAALDARFGRDDDVRVITAALEPRACVTVTGPGGIGKTRVAHAVAQAWEAGGGTVVAAALESLGPDDDVVTAVARALGVVSTTPADLVDQVDGALGAPGLLVWLDGAERVVEALAAPLARWRGSGGAPFLVTSRRPLGVAGERRHALGPLPTGDGRALFLDRALRPPPPDHPALDTLLAALDGWPLAIELAAARTDVLDVDALVSRLDRRLTLLAGGGPDRPARHRSLRACLEVSLELCSPDDRSALGQLAAFAGPFRAIDTERVLALDAGAWAVDAVGRLSDAGLLAAQPDGSLRLPAVVRETLPPVPPDAARRHAAFVAEEAQVALAALDGPEELAALARLGTLRDELGAVAVGAAHVDHVVVCALAAWVVASVAGPYLAAAPALAAAGRGGSAAVAIAHGELLLAVGRYEDALARVVHLDVEQLPTAAQAVRCLRLRARAANGAGRPDPRSQARAREIGAASQDHATAAWGLVAATEHRLEAPDTVALLTDALDHALAAGGTRLEATVRRYLGFTLARHGAPDRGVAELRRARALALAAGDRWLAAQIVLNGLQIHGWFGDGDGRAAILAARGEMVALGSRTGEVKALSFLAMHHAATGARDVAESVYREALALARRWGSGRDVIEVQKMFGSLLVDHGWPEEGVAMLTDAVDALRAFGMTQQAHTTGANLGRGLRKLGRHAEARVLYDAALDWFRAQGLRRDQAQTLYVLGLLHLELGEEPVALERWRQGLAAGRGFAHVEGHLFASLAAAAKRRGDPDAAELAAAAIERFTAAGDLRNAEVVRSKS